MLEERQNIWFTIYLIQTDWLIQGIYRWLWPYLDRIGQTCHTKLTSNGSFMLYVRYAQGYRWSLFPNRTFSESLPTWSSRAVPPLVMGGSSPIVQAGHDQRSKGRCVKKWWDFLRRGYVSWWEVLSMCLKVHHCLKVCKCLPQCSLCFIITESHLQKIDIVLYKRVFQKHCTMVQLNWQPNRQKEIKDTSEQQ